MSLNWPASRWVFSIVDVPHLIQLSLAPVFLLSGVGVILSLFTNRLARIVDRARDMERRLEQSRDPEQIAAMTATLRVTARRARYINTAITLATSAALLVSVVVVMLFANAFAPFELGMATAALFVTAMLLLASALFTFLLEVRIATVALRIGAGAPELKS